MVIKLNPQKGNAMKAFLTGIALLAIVSTGASAGWGCHVKNPVTEDFRDWGARTREIASTAVMKACQADKAADKCKLVACAEGVDTQDQAHALWPSSMPVIGCYNPPGAPATAACKHNRPGDK